MTDKELLEQVASGFDSLAVSVIPKDPTDADLGPLALLLERSFRAYCERLSAAVRRAAARL